MRAIAVIGPYRGGTSLVTGILERLGVFVGEDFWNIRAAYCTFEDLELRNICRRCFDEEPGRWCYLGQKHDRVQMLRDWAMNAREHAIEQKRLACGGKHPSFCKLIPELLEGWDVPGKLQPMLVSVLRPKDAIVRSWNRPLYNGQIFWDRWDQEYVVDDLMDSRVCSLTGIDHIEIDFETLIRTPNKCVSEFAAAIGLPQSRVVDAASIIRPVALPSPPTVH